MAYSPISKMLRVIIRAVCAVLLFGSWPCIGSERLAGVICNDLDGVARRPFDPGGKSASVLLFYWHDCPVCNSYAPEVNRIVASYTDFAFYIVQVDPDLTPGAAREHAKEYGLKAPILLDPKHRLVKLAKATVSPQAIIIDKHGRTLYSGRIDDLYTALGKRRAEATHHDLREALNAIAAGKQVQPKKNTPIGCLIQ
jgi:peroxiredoxin